jgi:hypothetical protein
MNVRVKKTVGVGLTFGLLATLACGATIALIELTAVRDRPKRVASSHGLSAQTAVRKAWSRNADGSPLRYGDGWFDDSGYFFAALFNGEASSTNSLEQVAAALSSRARRGISYMRGVLADLPRDGPGARADIVKLHLSIGGLHMYEGEFDAAARQFEAAREAEPLGDELVQANYEALLGIVALRRGEVENCVACCNEESCIFPLAAKAIHRRTSGSSEAMRRFLAYLEKRPDDIGVQWLLNVAAMTLGTYADEVPSRYLIPLEPFRSRIDVGRFPNVAARLGLDPGGNMAGGSIDARTSSSTASRGRSPTPSAATLGGPPPESGPGSITTRAPPASAT